MSKTVGRAYTQFISDLTDLCDKYSEIETIINHQLNGVQTLLVIKSLFEAHDSDLMEEIDEMTKVMLNEKYAHIVKSEELQEELM